MIKTFAKKKNISQIELLSNEAVKFSWIRKKIYVWQTKLGSREVNNHMN